MNTRKLTLTREDLIALVTDVYVAGFCDGRETSKFPFDRDMVLNSAFNAADKMAENLSSSNED